MRAVVIHCFGGMEAITIADLPVPAVAPGSVRVAVAAAGLNPADWKLREGWLVSAFVPNFPYPIGFDGAGTVDAVGDGVVGLAPGDRVVVKTAAGRGGGGAAAEFVTVPQELVCRIPDSLSFVDAATFPTGGITAWEMLFDAGRLQASETILVNGGAGGTGAIAVQLARHAGARVLATCSAANRDYVRGLGAQTVIDYQSGDVAAEVRRVCPGGVDMIVDLVGNGSLADPLALVRDGGRIIIVSTLIVDEPRPDPVEAARRNIRVETATTSREREGGQLRALMALVAAGHVRPPRTELVHPLDAAEAVERLRLGQTGGAKLVVTQDVVVRRGGRD